MARRATSEQDRAGEALGEAWGQLAEYVAYELNKDGVEGAVLSRLAPFPKTAFDIAWSEFGNKDFFIQCIGAVIPAYVPNMYEGTLGWMWEDLKTRRSKKKRNERIAAECNSVAERLLISATVWLDDPKLRDQGALVLEGMIRQTVEGTFWNDAHFAAAALVRAKVPGAGTLTKDLSQSRLGEEHFGEYLESLLKGDRRPFESIEILADTTRYRDFELPPDRREECEGLVRACTAWEPFAELDR